MRWFAALLLCLIANVALAQTCPTRPLTDNSNACASTAFVQGAIAGGVGIVNSVTNADGTLTIAPTTGAVVSSLNVAHANTWTGVQNLTATGNSIPLIGQGVNTTVTELVQPATPASGRAYAIAGQITGNGSGGQKVGVYGAAQNGVGNADQIWGGNFLAQWDVVTDVAVQGVEIDLNNNQSNSFSQAKAGLNITSGGSNVGGIALSIGNTSGSNKWNDGLVMTTWNNAGVVLGSPTTLTGGMGITGRQLANGNDTILLQRFTDSGPTGQFIRAVNAAASVNLFILDASGTLSAAGSLNSGAPGVANGNLVLNGTTSGNTSFQSTATGALAVDGNTTLSVTKTVRAAGGASDCTLIFTKGLLTGGSC